MTSRSRIIELGANACSILLVIDANSLKNMLIDSVIVKPTSMKKKKGPGSRRRFAMTTDEVSANHLCRVTEALLTVQRRVDDERVCDLVRQIHNH
jgi:hypothetical protein